MAKKLTRAQLERKVLELESQLIHVYHFADATIHKAGTSYMMASAVLLQITALGGREIIPAVAIRDGLSDETIAAIRADLRRSFSLGTVYKPKGVTP
jgi:hypothetical protein